MGEPMPMVITGFLQVVIQIVLYSGASGLQVVIHVVMYSSVVIHVVM